MSLPREVLALVFSHLEVNDLLQCQLASKQWHKASSRFLYSNLVGDTIERLFMYVRTIKHLPQLGKYLNTIDFSSLFYNVPEPDEFDHIGLLDSAIKYCPNITKIDGLVDNNRFWSRLIDAATQGQLSRLESLPRTFTPVSKSFIDTTLAFKNSLTSLWVYCDNFSYQPKSVYSAPYEALFNQIDQFQNVNALYIETPSFNCLSYFDELIDKFRSLKILDLSFTSDFYRAVEFTKSGPTILARPDIRSLKCFWRQIKDGSQLDYLMLKFPNLQCLVVESWCDGTGTFGPALTKFIQYALCVPDFELGMGLVENQMLNVWAEFTKTKNGCKSVALSYFEDYHVSAPYQLELSATSGWRLGIEFQSDVDELPHKKFLSKAGKLLRSLRLIDANFFQNIHHEPSTINWLFDILQLCPLLKELTIDDPAPSSPIHHTVQYPSLKKLTIDQPENIKEIDFLNCLSFNLPNLCQLSLILNDSYIDPVIIDMPQTSFDVLISSGGSAFRGSEVYIKLKTDKGLEYYLGERSMLAPISESRYLLSPESARFDINCKHLKELRIKRDLPEHGYSFIF